MHIVLHLVPLHGKTGAVAAKYGVGGVVQVSFRVISGSGHHGFLVVTGGIAFQRYLQDASALGVGGDLVGVVPKRLRRDRAGQQGIAARRLGRFEFTAHSTDVGDSPANLFCGHGQLKAVPGFQKLGLCLHKALPDSPVSGLAEIAAFRMLQMGFAHQKGDLHIRNGGADQHTPVHFLT